MVKNSAEMEPARRQRGELLEEQRVERNPGLWACAQTGRGMSAQGFPLVSPVTSQVNAGEGRTQLLSARLASESDGETPTPLVLCHL